MKDRGIKKCLQVNKSKIWRNCSITIHVGLKPIKVKHEELVNQIYSLYILDTIVETISLIVSSM